MTSAPSSGPPAATHRVVSEETVYQGWARFRRVEVRTADGHTVVREVEDHGEGAAVLAYDPVARTALLVSLARAPVVMRGEPDLLEAAAGLIDPGETPEAAARREALEELGLELGALEPVGVFWPLPGVSTERAHLYLAPYEPAARRSAGGGLAAEGEHLQVLEVPLSALLARLGDGRLGDMKTALLLMALHSRRPALFA